MNIVVKNIKKRTEKNRITKSKKLIFKNTKKFYKNHKIKIIDKHIDFIVCKLLNKNQNVINIERNINTVYSFQAINESKNNINNLYNTLQLFDKFVLLYSGFAFNNQKKIYNIYDFEKNKIGQLTLKNGNKLKKNINVIDSIELSGLFFHCYNSYLDDFLNYFGIEKNKNGVIKRLDYCIDLGGLEVFELLPYIKNKYKKTKNVNSLTATDKKALQENNTDIKYGRQETYINFFGIHNDLKIYDKILDILDNYKHRKVNGKNPYKNYLDSNFPITRIELKKKKFTNLSNNSINWVFNNIEALFFDFLIRYFNIDLSLLVGCNETLNGKKIFLAKEKKSKSLYHAMTMSLAYLKTIEELTSEQDMFKFLHKNFPNLQNTTDFNTLDIFEQYEYIKEKFENEK